jgi:hypothetical protein
MARSKIDWNFWLAMPYVRVWQAAALSLGIDPDKLANDESDAWEDCDPPDLLSLSELTKRIRLLAAARLDPQYFRAGASRGTPADHDIQLIPVGKWLKARSRIPIDENLLAASEAADRPLEISQPTIVTNGELAWINLARDEARRIAEARPKLSQSRMAEKIHEKFTANGTTGRGGKVPSSATIKRTALTGMKF